MTADAAITLEGVHKRFRLYHEKHPELKSAVLRGRRSRYEDLWALKGLDLQVPPGQALGVIGENGSGKSTLLKVMARILRPTKGRVQVCGAVATLLELGAGFQPDYSGIENIYLNGAILGLTRRRIAERIPDIARFSELDRFLSNPVRSYSSGMYMRLGFAIAVHVDADILLIDEVLAVGDEAFQRKCVDRIQTLRQKGRTLVFVSHDLAAVREVCDRAIWLQGGSVQADGHPEAVIEAYLGHVAAGLSPDGQEPVEGPARIHGVRLRDAAGAPRYAFQTGDHLEVEVDYELVEAVPRACVGVAIFRSDGVYCYGSNTRYDGIALDSTPGRRVARLVYPSLPLLRGTYQVTVGVFDEAYRPLVFQDRAYTIRVTSVEEDHGVVLIPHQWSVQG